MGIKHTKEFGVYHWDTFDNATFLIGEYDTFHEAQSSINEEYKGRLGVGGADKVDIVDSNGDILRQFSVRWVMSEQCARCGEMHPICDHHQPKGSPRLDILLKESEQ